MLVAALRAQDRQKVRLCLYEIAGIVCAKYGHRRHRRELQQDLWIHLDKSADKLDPDRNPFAYAYTCAVREVYRLKKNGRLAAKMRLQDEFEHIPDRRPEEAARLEEIQHAVRWRLRKYGLRRLAAAVTSPSTQTRDGRVILSRVARATGMGDNARDVAPAVGNLRRKLVRATGGTVKRAA